MKESDARRPYAVGVPCGLCLWFVSMRVCGRERGIYVERQGLGSRSPECWGDDLWLV